MQKCCGLKKLLIIHTSRNNNVSVQKIKSRPLLRLLFNVKDTEVVPKCKPKTEIEIYSRNHLNK